MRSAQRLFGWPSSEFVLHATRITHHAWKRLMERERILVRGVNWLGDAVMTTPALLRLREARPEAPIALLTPEQLAPLWQHHPAVSRTITFAPGEGVWSIARRLRAGAFSTALIFPNSPRSALECWLAGIPRRVGGKLPWRNWLFTDVVPPRLEAARMRKLSKSDIHERLIAAERLVGAGKPGYDWSSHQLHHYLHLAVALGANPRPLAPKLAVLDSEVDAVRQRFRLAASTLWFGLNAGAEYGPAKRWPIERFIQAAARLQKRTACRWVIFGGKSEVDLASSVASGIEHATPNSQRTSGSAVINLAGHTSLRELCAALKLCRVLLTNDTGPMHVAAAVGTPVVAPFGSTSPELTGPGLSGDPRHQLLKSGAPCSPCFRRICPIDFRCMTGIPVEHVEEAVLKAAGFHS